MSLPNPFEPFWVGPVLACVLGLILGSFINVIIHRLPLRQSVVFPGSRCPACREAIRSYDNIPILSYLILRGRCRNCRVFISPRYPLIEFLMGCASFAAFTRHGFGFEYGVELAFIAAILALVFIDFDHRILPNVITLPGTVVGLLLAGPRQSITLGDSLGGALLGAGLLFLVAEVYLRLRKIEGLGMGDVKMMGMVGAFLGWKGVLLTLFLGSLLGSLVGLVIMLAQGKDLKTALPFGTFLGVAAAITLFAGPFLITWYSGWF